MTGAKPADQQNHIQSRIHIAELSLFPALEWRQLWRLVHGAATRLRYHLDKLLDRPNLRVREKSGAMIYEQTDALYLQLTGNIAGLCQKSAR